ncbi:hypothetical protein F4821DRAFT_222485 [Hypoxylon rubiginosum]|uniref:Uncharacterized protein n=1 Tax=Hypoxylon rubiginosum TaxID=110542 RepID=A0ACC0DKW8_9PEZI|nr:hypothetical protein F4821DRAFT_222485 [Hypoxylon rubiginosum]
MASATTSRKSQSVSPTSTASMSDKENLDSNVSTEQKDSKEVTHKGFIELFREVEEKEAKMSPEEKAKIRAWPESFKAATPTTADQVPDLWDEI